MNKSKVTFETNGQKLILNLEVIKVEGTENEQLNFTLDAEPNLTPETQLGLSGWVFDQFMKSIGFQPKEEDKLPENGTEN